jgi:carboxyl-terminal processing protease
MTQALRLLAGVLALSGVSAALVALAVGRSGEEPGVPTVFREHTAADDDPPGPVPEANASEHDAGTSDDYAFPVPSGKPSSLTCADARMIIQQVRGTLAYAPPALSASALATATADWLDPHGLWSASPDSPIPEVLGQEAEPLLVDLEGGASTCDGARVVGEAMAKWVGDLGASFDGARRGGEAGKRALTAASLRTAEDDAPFEDEARPARRLAVTLGEHVGEVERGVGPAVTPYADTARARFFPPLDGEGWAGVVLAATVRAYVQLIDPHAEWAPHDEEASVYDVDLDAHPPDRLWDRAVRTALGVRVESGPMEPLAVGDLVLAIGDVATAGLPLEQLQQLVYATTDAPSSSPIVVLRRGEHELRTLELAPPEDTGPADTAPDPLPAYRVPYGAGDALIVAIHDIRSDLGDELSATLRRKKREDTRPIEELLLDLRDDGGGSTDGAMAALALFLPGAPLFPMERRDGSIEVDRAPEPPLADRWTRPVATLVDADTASAAEMIAGALLAYRRGPVVGQPTYGKGCAQEYLDDDAHVGVLRLTTLLYALPDGSPVQGVGIEPSLLLPPIGPESAHEHESDAPNAPPTWRGPDVRDRTRVVSGGLVWPEHGGKVGPCTDAEVCRALLALGGAASGKRPAAVLAPATVGSVRR